MKLHIIYIFLLFLFSTSCVTSQETKNTIIEDEDSLAIETTSKIEILDFEIVKTKHNKEKVSLLNRQLIAGELRESKIVYSSKELNKIIVHFLDENEQIIEELVIKEPYLQILEKYDAGEEVDTYDDAVEKHKFSIHFNQNFNISSVKIFKIDGGRTYEIFQEYLAR